MGLDLVALFRTAPSGYKHILVAMDKFTKWIEVRPVAMIMSKEAAKFIEDITHRFGVPNRIVTDLEKAFTGRTSGISARTASSMSTTLRWPTHGAMARSSEQTAWCFKPSKIASSTTPHNTRPDGMQSYLTSSGVFEPRSRVTRPSSWCTDQRRSSQLM
jgi:hypothetical protein